jgi:spore coat protein A
MLTTRLTRRSLLKAGAIAGAGLVAPARWLADTSAAMAYSRSDRLRKFIQPLRGIGGSGIPIAQPDPITRRWWQPGVTHYTIGLRQFSDQLHPDLPNPTRLWGFGQGGAANF